MAYERLNLKSGDPWKASDVEHIEDGIESKQDVLWGDLSGMIDFEEGTLSKDGDKVIETNRSDRARTGYIDIDSFVSVSLSDTTYSMWIFYCDSDKNAILLDLSNNIKSITSKTIKETYPTCQYVRFIVYSGSSSSGTIVDPIDIKKKFYTHVNILDSVPNIMVSVNNQTTELSQLKSIVQSKLFGPQKGIVFEQGGWNGATGALNTNTNRIHSDIFSTSAIINASCNEGYAFWYMTFDAQHNVLKNDTGVNYKGYTNIDFKWASAEKYVRFAIVNGKSNTANISPTEDTGFTLLVDTLQDVITEEVEKVTDGLSTNRHIGALGLPAYMLGDWTFSDATWVDDRYLGFSSSATDDLETTDPGYFWVYSFDNGLDKGYTSRIRFYHKWGHVNTIDYSPVNDCLIMGNGSGDYTLPGKIFIFPNFKEMLNSEAHRSSNDPWTLENSNAIVIDCTEYNLGTKFNVMWGEINGKKHNIAYLVTAKMGSSTSAPDGGDNGTIRRLLLGVGSTSLEYGQFNESASEGEFNGTFKIMGTWTQEGTKYANCNQGSCFYRGEIYSAVGHDGLWLWKMRLGDNGKISYDEWKQYAYDDNGQALNTNVTSCCIRDGYLYIGAMNMGTNAFKL